MTDKLLTVWGAGAAGLSAVSVQLHPHPLHSHVLPDPPDQGGGGADGPDHLRPQVRGSVNPQTWLGGAHRVVDHLVVPDRIWAQVKGRHRSRDTTDQCRNVHVGQRARINYWHISVRVVETLTPATCGWYRRVVQGPDQGGTRLHRCRAAGTHHDLMLWEAGLTLDTDQQRLTWAKQSHKSWYFCKMQLFVPQAYIYTTPKVSFNSDFSVITIQWWIHDS